MLLRGGKRSTDTGVAKTVAYGTARRALELAMQLCRRASRPLEQRGIEQKRAAIGECAEVPVGLSPARAAPQLPRPRRAYHAGIEVQVAPEVFKLRAVPIEELRKSPIKLHAKVVRKPRIVSFTRWPGTARRTRLLLPGDGAGTSQASRQILLDARRESQQSFAADSLDQLAMAGRMREQRAPAIRLCIAANELRRQSSAAQCDR